ncbi:MAG: 8-oxo-dGTP diphosphatase [Trueperaceae bacterium]|nr:8-oxo-dGTP diphosphatase [Trueperaceae bacterium]
MILTTLAYVRDGERTLMLRRPDAPARLGGRWNGLGGKFEPGESPERCVRREVREESGLEVEHAELKGIITFPAFTPGGDDVMTFVYVIRAWSGTLVPEGPEGTLHWIATHDVADLDLWSGDVVFLPWLERPGLFSARFRYEEGRYRDHEVVFYADASAASASGAHDVIAS